jgi:hypothetical protein
MSLGVARSLERNVVHQEVGDVRVVVAAQYRPDTLSSRCSCSDGIGRAQPSTQEHTPREPWKV